MSCARMTPLCCMMVFLTVTAAATDGFIRVSGTHFVDEDCRPFVYSGWNSWELLEAAAFISSVLPRQNSFLNGTAYVDFKLDLLKENGFTVGRIFAHGHHESILTLQHEPGVYNEDAWVALDRLLDAAGQRGLKLILTFSDNWKTVDSRPAYAEWAGLDGGSFYTDDKIRTWYRNHIERMVNRENSVNGRLYKEDPTIFAWNLMNEPRCDCSVRRFSDACEKPCADNIQMWIEEMSTFLKTQDPYHMVTVGEEGFYGLESGREEINPDSVKTVEWNGLEYSEFLRVYNLTNDTANWSARSGQDFVRNHKMKSIDYAATHLWPDNWGGMSIEFQTQWIEAHAIDAAALNKPLTIEEFGKILEGNNPEEIKSVRNPYFKEVYDTFDRLKSTYPLRGIAFWEFDAKYLDEAGGYTVYPTHSTFEEIIVPATKKITDDVAALPVLEDCFPGEDRSYDTVTVEGTTYVTAGVCLIAVEEGDDLSDELEASSVDECLAQCEQSVRCDSVSYNQDRMSCFLKARPDKALDVEVMWSNDGWQSYWKAPVDIA